MYPEIDVGDLVWSPKHNCLGVVTKVDMELRHGNSEDNPSYDLVDAGTGQPIRAQVRKHTKITGFNGEDDFECCVIKIADGSASLRQLQAAKRKEEIDAHEDKLDRLEREDNVSEARASVATALQRHIGKTITTGFNADEGALKMSTATDKRLADFIEYGELSRTAVIWLLFQCGRQAMCDQHGTLSIRFCDLEAFAKHITIQVRSYVTDRPIEATVSVTHDSEWLNAAHTWIQSNLVYGDSLDWSSTAVVRVDLDKMQELAKVVARAACQNI